MARRDGSDSGQKKIDGREQRGDRTARALIDAARTAFAERGYAGASVREIARAADANPALVRYHFGSKEGLYHRVIDDVMSGLRERLTEAFLKGDSLRERTVNLVRAYVDYLGAERDFPKLAWRASLDSDTGAQRIARDHLRPLFDSISLVVSMLKESPLGGFEQSILSVFGATLLPFIYAPTLMEVLEGDLFTKGRLAERREHLLALVGMMVDTYLPEPSH